MENKDIYKFFIERGALPYFEIVDSPVFDFHGVNIEIHSSLISISDFIDEYLNDSSITIYLYKHQDFINYDGYMRYAGFNIPHNIIRHRKETLLKIRNGKYKNICTDN